VQNASVIVDKGFCSQANIEELKLSKLNFIIPLKRNDKLIDYQKISSGNRQNLDGHFLFNKRYIWHYSYSIDENTDLYIFIDNDLKNEEEHYYLFRCDKKCEKYTLENFHKKQAQFGTLAMLAKKGLPVKRVYEDYKTRANVETMINAFKNIYDADRTFMQNEQSLEAWIFINFLALMFYYKILNLLKINDLNSEYSPNDLIMYLASIKKIKINEHLWFDTERTNATEKLLKKLNLSSIP